MAGKNHAMKSNAEAEARLALSLIKSSGKRASEIRAKAEQFRGQGTLVKSKSYLARAKLMEIKESLKGVPTGFSQAPSDGRGRAVSASLPAGSRATASSQLRALSSRLFSKA